MSIFGTALSMQLDAKARRARKEQEDKASDELTALRTRIAELESENARLTHLRSLVARAFAALGPTGYFPSMGAPLSDEIRNALAKDYPSIKAVEGFGANRRAAGEREG